MRSEKERERFVSSLGKGLKALRKSHGKNQKQVAAGINSAHQTISAYERGVSVPSLEVILALMDFFEVEFEELFGAPAPKSTRIGQLLRRQAELEVEKRILELTLKAYRDATTVLPDVLLHEQIKEETVLVMRTLVGPNNRSLTVEIKLVPHSGRLRVVESSWADVAPLDEGIEELDTVPDLVRDLRSVSAEKSAKSHSDAEDGKRPPGNQHGGAA